MTINKGFACVRDEFGWRNYTNGNVDIWFNGVLTQNMIEIDIISMSYHDISYLVELVESVSGSFALIIRTNKWLFAACDKINSIPISYVITNEGEFFVGDHAPLLMKKSGLDVVKEVNKQAALEIAMSGYCTGSKTLYENVYQLSAGEYVVFDSGNLTNGYYYTYSPLKYEKHTSKNLLINEFSDVCWASIDELVESVNSRQIVVPLSAGNDSRLIVSLLKEKGFKDVVCFSFGKKNNFEVQTARNIAEKLGYQWIDTTCTVDSQRMFFQSSVYHEYIDSFNTYSSIPAVHDIYSVHRLYEHNLISKDAVIVNGNSGDFISGGHIQNKISMSAYLDKHYSLWGDLRTNVNDKRIIKELLKVTDDRNLYADGEYIDSYFESLEYVGRQTQYVVKQQHAYDFFNYEWRLPLWSACFLDFWEQVPVEYKVGQKLYIDTLKKNNWGGVWLDIPVNKMQANSFSLGFLRGIIKSLFIPLGKDNWHKFDKKVFQYWMDVSCNTVIASYSDVLTDRRGSRSYISWVTDQYLKKHGV